MGQRGSEWTDGGERAYGPSNQARVTANCLDELGRSHARGGTAKAELEGAYRASEERMKQAEKLWPANPHGDGPPPRSILNALAAVDQVVDQLEDRVGILTARLELVLNHQKVGNKPTDVPPTAEGAQLYDRLVVQMLRLGRLHGLLNDLEARLEL